MPNLNQLTFERLIDFVSIDLTPWNLGIQRFTNTSTYEAGLPELSHIDWQGHTWLAIPFETGGIQRGGENLTTAALQVADFTGELYQLLRELNGAPGAVVKIHSAFGDDIEAGITNGAFRTVEYVLNRVSRQTMMLELELATHMDFANIKVPGFKQTREDYPGLGSALLRG